MNIEQHDIEPGGYYYGSLMTPELYARTDYFKNYETERWGNPLNMNVPLIYYLDGLRALAGKPVNIHCGFEIKGHAKNGYHPRGKAADIHIKNMSVIDQLLLALKFPFNGVGIYPFWNSPGIHVDVRLFHRYKRVWYRDKEGVYHNLSSIEQIT